MDIYEYILNPYNCLNIVTDLLAIMLNIMNKIWDFQMYNKL